MNLSVNFGKQQTGEPLSLDFEKDNIGLTLLVGCTFTGKSVLHYHIYKQLIEQNSPDEIGFVFIDNTRVDFSFFNAVPAYLYVPISWGGEQSLNILEGLAGRVDEINNGQKHLFIHIEECDLFYQDPERLEKSLKQLLKAKENSKIHIIFSTSRPAKDVILPWLLELTDLKGIFQMASVTDYITVTGKNYSPDLRNALVGEKIILFRDKAYHLLPLTPEESALPKIFSNPNPSIKVAKVTKAKRTFFEIVLVIVGVLFLVVLLVLKLSGQI